MPSPEIGGLDPHTAAQAEFNVDLNDTKAVYAKILALSHEANRTGRYEEVNRLNALLEAHTGQKSQESSKAA